MDLQKIFIVEDDAIIRMVLQELIEKMGFQLAGYAASAVKAISLIKESTPELVILDIGLEGEIDGIEVGNILNKQFQIPFIYVTGNSDQITIDRARKTNPLGFIYKPFRAENFQEAFRGLLGEIKME